MPFRCPACHHFSDLRGHLVAHMELRKAARAKAQKRKQEDEVQANLSAQASAAVSQPSRISFKDREMLACCTNTCRRGSMAVKGASRGCAGWHRMPA
eukprot:jgi/Astpho2/7319/Aster-01621